MAERSATGPHKTPVADGADFALEACRAQLHQFLRRRSRDRRDVTDLVQEVYVRFLQAPQHGPLREPLAYLYRIAANLLNDLHERERRALVTYDSELADALAAQPPQVDQEALSEQLNAERQLEKTLAQLPGIYQSVLLLRKRDGLSCAEIAKALNISRHTAEKYLYRAIAHFKAADWDQPG